MWHAQQQRITNRDLLLTMGMCKSMDGNSLFIGFLCSLMLLFGLPPLNALNSLISHPTNDRVLLQIIHNAWKFNKLHVGFLYSAGVVMLLQSKWMAQQQHHKISRNKY